MLQAGLKQSLKRAGRQPLASHGFSMQPEYGPARQVNAVPRRLAETATLSKELDSRLMWDLRKVEAPCGVVARQQSGSRKPLLFRMLDLFVCAG